MGKVTLKVEHALGRTEALARIRRAAEGMDAKAAKYVRSVQWSESGAVVDGDGFSGAFTVTDTDVTADVELGWKLAFFPLKVQRDGEAFLRNLLS